MRSIIFAVFGAFFLFYSTFCAAINDYEAINKELLKLKAEVGLVTELSSHLKSPNSIMTARTALACYNWNAALVLAALRSDLDTITDETPVDFDILSSTLFLCSQPFRLFQTHMEPNEENWIPFNEGNLRFYNENPMFSGCVRYFEWDKTSHTLKGQPNLDYYRWYQLAMALIPAYPTLGQEGQTQLKQMITILLNIHMQIAEIYKITIVPMPDQLFLNMIHRLAGNELTAMRVSLQELSGSLQAGDLASTETKTKLHFEQIANILYATPFLKRTEHIIAIGDRAIDAVDLVNEFRQGAPLYWIEAIQTARTTGSTIGGAAFNALCFDYEMSGQLLSPTHMVKAYLENAPKDWNGENQTLSVLFARLGLALVFEYLSHHLKLEDH